MTETATATASKLKIEYVDKADQPCAIAQAWGIRVSDSSGQTLYGLADGGPQDRMFAAFGMFTLATATARRANAPLAEVDARFARVTPDAWGDEKQPKTRKTRQTPEQKLAAQIDDLLAIAAAARVAQGDPIKDLAAARDKMLNGVPAKDGRPAISALEYRKGIRRDPHVAAEFAKRKAASTTAATLKADGLSAL